MKRLLTFFVVLLMASTSFGQDQLCDDLESLPIGGLNPAIPSSLGINWGAFDGMVFDNGGSLAINQINTFVDDVFFAEIQADLTTSGFVLDAAAGLNITVEYSLSDFNTQRFFTPVDTVAGIIFTRLGDTDQDGDWDVLETDGAGNGVFIDTGVMMPLSGTIEFDILGTAMEISVDGAVVYTGSIIGSNGDTGGALPQNLDLFNFDSGNNVGGMGSEIIIDNFGVNMTCSGMGGGGFVPPVTFQNFRGAVLSSAITDFADSDDVSATYNPGFTLNNLEAPVWLIFDAVAPTATDFRVESNAGTPGLTYTIEAFNWGTNSFDVIGTEGESFNSDTISETPIVAADHIDPAGNVRGRVGWRQTGFVINFPWEVRVDQAGWNQ